RMSLPAKATTSPPCAPRWRPRRTRGRYCAASPRLARHDALPACRVPWRMRGGADGPHHVMTYLLWSLPALIVIAAIASGRLNTTLAAVLGLLAAIPVALFAAPGAFGAGPLGHALARGLWIGGIITPYILGGLLFWQMAARGAPGQASTANSANGPAA